MFHNSNLFGSHIIHILCTGCAKIEKNNSGAKRLKGIWTNDCTECVSCEYFNVESRLIKKRANKNNGHCYLLLICLYYL